jgi:succinate-acetate transporter protein
MDATSTVPRRADRGPPLARMAGSSMGSATHDGLPRETRDPGGPLVLIAVGALMALLVMTDAVRTTINLSETTGPLARTVVGLGRRVARRLPERARSSAGLFITVGVVVSWTLGLWLSWSVALLDPSVSIVRASDGSPLGVAETFYLAGFSVFTLGTGDVEAVTNAGRFVSIAASATGLFTVTLEVTYLLSLTQAAAHERATARQAYALGCDVGTIVRQAYRDRSFAGVEPLLFRLASDLSHLAEHHRTFPVLHDVLPRERSLALGPSLLALSDALDAMHRAVPAEAAVGVLAYQQLTEAMDGLVARLPPMEDGLPEAPPRPDPAELLLRAGCEVEVELRADPEAEQRRRGLYALAVEEGWQEVAEAVVRLPSSAEVSG